MPYGNTGTRKIYTVDDIIKMKKNLDISNGNTGTRKIYTVDDIIKMKAGTYQKPSQNEGASPVKPNPYAKAVKTPVDIEKKLLSMTLDVLPKPGETVLRANKPSLGQKISGFIKKTGDYAKVAGYQAAKTMGGGAISKFIEDKVIGDYVGKPKTEAERKEKEKRIEKNILNSYMGYNPNYDVSQDTGVQTAKGVGDITGVIGQLAVGNKAAAITKLPKLAQLGTVGAGSGVLQAYGNGANGGGIAKEAAINATANMAGGSLAKSGTKLLTGNLGKKVLGRAVQGAGEMLPVSTLSTAGKDLTAQDRAKQAAIDVGLGVTVGAGGELVWQGASKIIKTISDKIKAGKPLTTAERQIILQLPEPQRQLLLTEGSIKLPPAKTVVKPTESVKPDFYATPNNIAKNMSEFSTPPKQPLMLPEGNVKTPAKTLEGNYTIKPKFTGGYNLVDTPRGKPFSESETIKKLVPAYETKLPSKNTNALKEFLERESNKQTIINANPNKELPFVIQKGETKRVLPKNTNKLSTVFERQQAEKDLIKSGVYSGVGSNKYDFVKAPEQYTPSESMYKNAVGQRETPFTVFRGEKAPEQVNNILPKIALPKTAENVLPDTKQYIVSKTAKPRSGNIVKKTYNSMVDDLYPIKPVSEKAYVKALNTRQADMIAYRSLTTGLVDKSGNVINESLKDIIKQIPKDKQLDFIDYLINRHAPTWIEQGRKVFPDEAGITADVARAKVAQYEAMNPEFKQLGDRFSKYQQNLAKTWLVDSGVMKPEVWDDLVKKYPDCVPYQREFSEIEGKGGIFAKRGFVNQSNPIKKGVGSQRRIVDPIETVIERTGQYIKTAKRNEVGQAILNEVRQNPEAFKGIIEIEAPKSASASSELINNVNEILQKDGIDGLISKFNEPWERQQFLANKGGAINKGQNVVTVLENGVPVYMKIKDMDLLKALSNLNPQQATNFTRAVGKATGIMKTLTTGINPVFGLARNIWRDFATGYINSKTIKANPLGYAQYMWDLTRAIGNTIAEPLGRAEFLPKTFQDIFKKGGEPMAYFKNIGGGGHVSAISSDRNLLAKAKADVLPKTGLQKVTSIPSKLYRGLENLNNTLEVAPRLAEAKRVLKQGGNADKVLFESQDLTVNFSRKGNVTKEVDSLIPYLNAAVQGLDKVARVYNPKSVGSKQVANAVVKSVYAVTIPSIVLYAINHKDEGYNMLSDYHKDNFFNIPNDDGTFTRIPKPREQGVVFGSLVERTLRAFKDNEPEAFNRFADAVKVNFMPPTEFIWQPAQDIWKTSEGRDWRGNPIVNQSMLSLSPKYQYNENTSEPAKFIGNMFNLSPKKIDATSKAYLGGLATIGIPATTKGKSIGQALKQQVVTDPLYSNDILNDFYNNRSKLDTEKADSKITGDTTRDNLRSNFTKSAADISTLRNLSTKVQNSDMANKDEIVRSLQKQMLDVASNASKTLKANDNSINAKYPELTETYYPESSFTFNKEKIELTPEEYFKYQQLADKKFKEISSNIRMSKNFNNYNDDIKEKIIKKMLDDATKYAKQQIMRERKLKGY